MVIVSACGQLKEVTANFSVWWYSYQRPPVIKVITPKTTSASLMVASVLCLVCVIVWKWSAEPVSGRSKEG